MKLLRRYRTIIGSFLVALMFSWQIGQPLHAATFYWDTDTSAVGNALDGAGLGGTGAWDLTTGNWWDQTNLVNYTNGSTDRAIFTGPVTGGAPTPATVTLASGIVANQLSFLRGGYHLTGGTLSLDGVAPSIYSTIGTTNTIDTQLVGTSGLTKTGGGAVRLTNNTNSYTGTTTISNGSIIISSEGALGADTSTIVVTGFSPVQGSTNLRGFGGGALVIDALAGPLAFSRNISLQGLGPISDRSAALQTHGNVNLSGNIDTGVAYLGTAQNTRISSANGTLTLSGTLNVQGTAGTTITNLGGVNQAGASFYNMTGPLAGSGTLEKSGGGTLYLNPTDTSGFSGILRISGSAASGQSSVRITSPMNLGSRTATGTGGVLDMNGGTLEVRMDAPSLLAGGAPANVYQRTSSPIFVDHALGSSTINGLLQLGQMAYEDNITNTFNSRNGYGIAFGAAPVVGTTAGDNNSTITNNLAGLLSFTGNFWSNSNTGAARTMTIGGNGNTVLNGNIIATGGGSFDHIVTKTGAGSLTILATGATLDGTVNANGGAVVLTDFRSINMHTAGSNTGTLAINGGAVVFGTNVAPTQAGLTTARPVNLSGTTGGATLFANQLGSVPVVFNTAFTATGAGVKTLTLGGSNAGENIINGAIVNNSGTNTTAVAKVGSGVWALAGTNSYTGATTISNGVLRIRANAPTSTVLSASNGITFNANNVFGGGTLELVGQNGVVNVQALGALTPTAGSGTVKLSPGVGGSASITFASLGTVGGGGTINVVTPSASSRVALATTALSNNIANAGVYYNGADFALVPGANQAWRAPIYGTDTDFADATTALTAGQSNQVSASFTTSGALAIDSLKINGNHTLTLADTLTIRTAAGSTASGGILQTGGAGTIDGAFTIGTNNTAATVIRVNTLSDTLTIAATLIGSGGFTKSGAGTLILSGNNV